MITSESKGGNVEARNHRKDILLFGFSVEFAGDLHSSPECLRISRAMADMSSSP
jgi:hypothetical protein